jgi:hypothetical protein
VRRMLRSVTSEAEETPRRAGRQGVKKLDVSLTTWGRAGVFLLSLSFIVVGPAWPPFRIGCCRVCLRWRGPN